MGRRYFPVAGMALLSVVVLAACGSTGEDNAVPTVTRIPDVVNAPVLTPTGEASPTSEAAAAGTPAPVAASPAAGTPVGAAAYEVVLNDIFFTPSELTIPADTPVTISLPNNGAASHNFSIDELDISIDLAPGEVKEVEINAPAGVYEYYCNVPGHREAGMVGTLTVE